jgi:hypothetical protein
MEAINQKLGTNLTEEQYANIKKHIFENLDKDDLTTIKDNAKKIVSKLFALLDDIKPEISIYDYLKKRYLPAKRTYIGGERTVDDFSCDLQQEWELYNNVIETLGKCFDEEDSVFDFKCDLDTLIFQAIPLNETSRIYINMESDPQKYKSKYSNKKLKNIDDKFYKYCCEYIKNNFPKHF